MQYEIDVNLNSLPFLHRLAKLVGNGKTKQIITFAIFLPGFILQLTLFVIFLDIKLIWTKLPGTRLVIKHNLDFARIISPQSMSLSIIFTFVPYFCCNYFARRKMMMSVIGICILYLHNIEIKKNSNLKKKFFQVRECCIRKRASN